MSDIDTLARAKWLGMSSSDPYPDNERSVKAWCTEDDVHVTLFDGRTISAPLWWYPFLNGLDQARLNDIELMYEGIWRNAVDEGVSIKSMFLGQKGRGAVAPGKAA